MTVSQACGGQQIARRISCLLQLLTGADNCGPCKQCTCSSTSGGGPCSGFSCIKKASMLPNNRVLLENGFFGKPTEVARGRRATAGEDVGNLF